MAGCVREPAINLNYRRRCGDAVYRDLVRGRLDEAGGKHTVEVLLDIGSFFDVMEHNVLVREAAAAQYPLILLRVSLAKYQATRAPVGDFGLASPRMCASRGVAAGSPPTPLSRRRPCVLGKFGLTSPAGQCPGFRCMSTT